MSNITSKVYSYKLPCMCKHAYTDPYYDMSPIAGTAAEGVTRTGGIKSKDPSVDVHKNKDIIEYNKTTPKYVAQEFGRKDNWLNAISAAGRGFAYQVPGALDIVGHFAYPIDTILGTNMSDTWHEGAQRAYSFINNRIFPYTNNISDGQKDALNTVALGTDFAVGMALGSKLGGPKGGKYLPNPAFNPSVQKIVADKTLRTLLLGDNAAVPILFGIRGGVESLRGGEDPSNAIPIKGSVRPDKQLDDMSNGVARNSARKGLTLNRFNGGDPRDYETNVVNFDTMRMEPKVIPGMEKLHENATRVQQANSFIDLMNARRNKQQK